MNDEIKQKLKEKSDSMEAIIKNKELVMNSTLEPSHKKRIILNSDKMGYEISLEYNELLRSNGYISDIATKDYVFIDASSLLQKFNISIQMSREISHYDYTEVHYSYKIPEVIKAEYEEVMNKINNLFEEGILDEYTVERLSEAASYFEKLSSLDNAYYNGNDYQHLR